MSEKGHHINYLELLAIFYGLQVFCSEMKDIHISTQSDSTNVKAYINNFGGMASREMDFLAKNIWENCLSRNIFISVCYIASSVNCADFN